MPRFAILRWIPDEMKYVVEHYGYKESEVQERYEKLLQIYSEEHLSLLISKDALSNKAALSTLRNLLKGVKRDK